MINRILLGLAIFASATTCAYADGVVDILGRLFGSFGVGVSKSAKGRSIEQNARP